MLNFLKSIVGLFCLAGLVLLVAVNLLMLLPTIGVGYLFYLLIKVPGDPGFTQVIKNKLEEISNRDATSPDDGESWKDEHDSLYGD